VLAPGGLGMALFVLALLLLLAWAHRDAFRGMLAARSGERAPAAHSRVSEPAVGRV